MFSCRGLLTVAVASAIALPAFTQTNFQYQAYSYPDGSIANLAAPRGHLADFNGDGLADVLAVGYTYVCSSNGSGETCNKQNLLTLSLNNGSGGLLTATQLNPFGPQPVPNPNSWMPAIGDFNGDGKLDIAVLSSDGNISIMYGNGDGTFGAPVLSNVVGGLYTSFVEADFDANGTPDLTALNQNGQLVMLFNDGKGNFTQQTVTLDPPSSNYTVNTLTVGDFNGDGRPDLAWAEEPSAGVSYGPTPVMSALNTAKGVFSAKQQVGLSSNGFAEIVAADLDLDGRTDLIIWTAELDGCCSGFPQTLYYSNGDGTFTSKPLATLDDVFDVEVTDINGDGNPDVLVSDYNGVEVFTGNGNRTFTDDGAYTGLPGGAGQLGLGFFTTSNAMGFAAPNGGTDGTMTSPDDALFVAANNNPQGNCAYPATAGVSFCSAIQNGDSAHVQGTARAQTQPVEEIQLWANGTLLYQVQSDEFNATLNVAPGTAITAVEVEANGATRSATVKPSATACAAPSSPGVNVCSPTQGATVSSPVTVTAAGTGASGSVNHLELWIDGNKVGQYTGATMSASVPLTVGSHAITVIEVDSAWNYVKSNTINVTVGSSTGACAAPSSPGVNLCSPTQGETTTSPVSVNAAGTGASGTVNHLELWIDGSKIGDYSGATMNTSVPLAAGSHAVTVIEVDSKWAYVKSTTVNVTVTGSGPCAAPGSPGVNLCTPTQGETTGSPVAVIAAGTGASGSVNHLELWIDGSKIGDYNGATMNTTVSLPAGSHGVTVIEVDSKWNYVKSNTVNITVQ